MAVAHKFRSALLLALFMEGLPTIRPLSCQPASKWGFFVENSRRCRHYRRPGPCAG
jgi:hypothetical protein